MVRWLVAGFIAFVALASVWEAAVFAQTTAQTSSTSQTSSTTGAFDSLSPGNQKIARALYEAQTTGSGGTTTANGTTTAPLTLDEIAAKKQGGQGWGNVFKDMKAQGLVQDKNLGQAVSRYQRSTHGGTSTTQSATYTASGRQLNTGSRGHGAKSLDDGTVGKHGYGKQGGGYGNGGSGNGQAYASGSSHSNAGGSGGGSGHGRGGSK